jgi:glycosyltransferase involved in cell wall biosynthesis
MRILFVADGRSPTALNWIDHFLAQGHQVHLASTFDCTPDKRLASYHLTPAAFSELKRVGVSRAGAAARKRGVWGASMVRARTLVRQWLGPLTLPAAARQLRQAIDQVQPEIVHAFRIPYEGMLAALADPSAPLLVSVWGNDFTLHAPSTPLMGWYTRRTLRRADALHADCQRDVRLARTWGFGADKPAVVLPGGGGIQLDVFYPADQEPAGPETVINPRGIRAYVRNDIFFRAVPLVLAQRPEVRFLCPTMAGDAQALRWLEESGCTTQVDLLGFQPRSGMADLYRQSSVVVSPSMHDGTPNTLLEAMACGCFPVVGDIESLREWINQGVNGLLVDPGDAQALAEAILTALRRPELRQSAREYNLRLVNERAEYGRTMSKAEQFYSGLVKS